MERTNRNIRITDSNHTSSLSHLINLLTYHPAYYTYDENFKSKQLLGKAHITL